jgi:hypothetical protein
MYYEIDYCRSVDAGAAETVVQVEIKYRSLVNLTRASSMWQIYLKYVGLALKLNNLFKLFIDVN